MLTPADVHFGRASAILIARQNVLDAAYGATRNASREAGPELRSSPKRSTSTHPHSRSYNQEVLTKSNPWVSQCR